MAISIDFQTIPYLAFGYHMAAIRGEAPIGISQFNVETWIMFRPWAQAKHWEILGKSFHTISSADEEYFEWVANAAERIINQLYRIRVVRDKNGKIASWPAGDNSAGGTVSAGPNLHLAGRRTGEAKLPAAGRVGTSAAAG